MHITFAADFVRMAFVGEEEEGCFQTEFWCLVSGSNTQEQMRVYGDIKG